MISEYSKTICSIILASALVVINADVRILDPAMEDEWRIEIVDDDSGVETSIALDDSNNPHISYMDGIYYDLRYAKWNGTGWEIEIVDSNGIVGWFTSIALDSNNYPHISYNAGNIKYAYWNGTAWRIQTIDFNGGWTSLALNSQGHPHISYSLKDRIMHAEWNGTNWIRRTIDNVGMPYGGGWHSIEIDSDDNPHVSYYAAPHADLKYARWNGSAWNTTFVDDYGVVGPWNSLELDSHDFPHIAYQEWFDYGNSNQKYARWNGTGWELEVVEYGSSGRYGSLALDSHDAPHLTFHDPSTSRLLYAKSSEYGWSFETIDAFVRDGSWSSLTIGLGDMPHVCYFQRTGGIYGGKLLYATKVNLLPLRSVEMEIEPDTLNLKSRGKWITAYLVTQNASANDVNVDSLLLEGLFPYSWEIQNETILMLKFDREAFQEDLPVSPRLEVELTGLWNDGMEFMVSDQVTVIERGHPKPMLCVR